MNRRSIGNLNPLGNSYRVSVTVKSQLMTLTHDRSEAGPLDRSQAFADPQGHAPQHQGRTAMRAAAARPEKAEVFAVRCEVRSQ